MANSILTASVAIVKVGGLDFEGLMFEDDSFGIALQQVASVFQFYQIQPKYG